MEGCSLGVVEDSLIRDFDVKDFTKDIGCFSGGDGEGDVEGKDQAKDILRVVDFCNIDQRLKG